MIKRIAFLVFVSLLPSFAGQNYALDLWDQAYGKPAKKVSLYNDPTNPWVQEFNVSMRMQYVGAAVSANQDGYAGSHDSTGEWRRFRLGANMRVLENFRLNNIWNIGGLDTMGFERRGVWYDHGTSRGNLYEASLTYVCEDCFSVGLGKNFPLFMAENGMSSATYHMPEVPMLEGQLLSESSFGVWAGNERKSSMLGWNAGVWSNTVERSRGTWGTWQSAFTYGGVSCRVDDALLNKGRVYLDWIHNWQDMGAVATSTFRDSFVGPAAQDIFALYYKGEQGAFNLMLEAIWGSNPASYKSGSAVVNPSDVFGVIVMPMYMLTDHVQAVARYQWTTGDNAVKLGKRYSSLVKTNGSYVDDYQAIGVGLNFYLYAEDHARMKIMTMAEYGNSNKSSSTGGFTGWTFIGGIYTNF